MVEKPKPKKTTTIRTWKELQARVGEILERLNEDPDLVLAAAANPLEALRELGYSLGEDLEREVEARLRFGPQDGPRKVELEKAVVAAVGRPVDALDDREVDRVLAKAGLRPGSRKADRLEPLRGKHPVIEPLIELRDIERRAPRFASPDTYQRLRSGKARLPITRLRARLKDEGRGDG